MAWRAAEEGEQQVTIPIEIQMAGIPHLVHLRSTTLAGLSSLMLIFDDESSNDWNRENVLERLSQVTLPTGLQPQIGTDFSPVGQIMFYRLTSTNPQYGNMELKSLEGWTLEKQFKSVPCVVDVSSFGGMTRSFRSTSIPKSSFPMASASLTQEGDYPYEDHVTFTVTSSLPTELTLHFRIPAWAEGASVSIPLLGATEKNAPSVRTPIRLMSTLNFTLRRPRRSRYSVQPSVILATIAP